MSRREWAYAASTASLVVIAAASIEFAMGRVPVCRCGYVKLWHGVMNSSENSQHITDWYTFSHIIHGIGLDALLWLVARRMPPSARLVLAAALEATWAVFENTPFVVERYRAVTISLDYYGDSIVNSMSDIAAMISDSGSRNAYRCGLASRWFVVLETTVGAIIRDNLTLNVLMLIHPFEAIKRWQLGA